MIQNRSPSATHTLFLFIQLLAIISSLVCFSYAQQEGVESPVLAAILQENDSLLQELLRNGGNPNENVAGWTPLHAAASKGNSEWVTLLVNRGGNVNAKNLDDRTPLHEAIGENNLEVAEILLDNHANPNAKDKNGDSALHVASVISIPAVTLLISHKADPNIANNNGATPLFYAAAFGKDEIVRYLIANGANPKHVTSGSLTPLHEAAISGNVDVLNSLVNAGVSVNSFSADGWSPLHNAVQFSQKAFTKALLEKGASVNQQHAASQRTPLFVACLNATSEIVSLLLLHGADPSIADSTHTYPIHVAAFRGDVDMISALYNDGASVNVRDEEGATPLHKATYVQSLPAIKYLLQKKASANLGTYERRWTPLMIATALANFDLVKALVDGGADVRISSFERASPVQIAAAAGSSQIVDFLIQKGANLDTFDAKGWTPLHNAIQGHHVDTVKVIVKHVDPNKTYNGVLPVTLAGILGHNDLVEILLQNGASANIEDAEGWTPLQHLSGLGNEVAVSLLLKHGAKLDHQNKEGFNALQIAQINNKFNVIGALAEAGADLKQLDVAKWLAYHDFENLIPLFEQNQITGDVLPDLTKSVLKEELGITKIGTLVKLTKAISSLSPHSHSVHDEL